MEREYDWSKAPKVGDIIKKVYFQDEEITKNSTMIRCDCRVVKVDEEVGSIYLMATENMFKERPFDGIHTWKAKFSVGNYLYRAESIGCLDLEAFDEICRENPEYLDLGFDYWTSEYDTDDNMAYFITSYGNLDKADRRGIKKCPLPFFVFDPEYYEAVTDNSFGTTEFNNRTTLGVIKKFISEDNESRSAFYIMSDYNGHCFVAEHSTAAPFDTFDIGDLVTIKNLPLIGDLQNECTFLSAKTILSDLMFKHPDYQINGFITGEIRSKHPILAMTKVIQIDKRYEISEVDFDIKFWLPA